MTTYAHNEIAVPGGAQWFNANIDGNNPIIATSTLLVLPNSDGTQTHIIGTDFTYDVGGNPTGGLVTQIDRTNSDGATVYETVTGPQPVSLYSEVYDWTGDILIYSDFYTLFEYDLVSVFSSLTSPGGFEFIYSFCDALNGFSGDDLFFSSNIDFAWPVVGYPLSQSFDGGGGTDTVSYENTSGVVYADLGDPATNAGDASGDTYTSIENLIGSSNSDSLFGNSSVNVLSGGLGNDLLDGRGGGDTMIGGLGSDRYFVDSTTDLVLENPGEGNDRVYASLDYTLAANIEALRLLEGAGNINGTGNDLDNVLVGNFEANTLYGMDGDDIFNGEDLVWTVKAGDDTLIGGAGNDTYFARNINGTTDLVIEDPGERFDTVLALGDYTLGANIESLRLLETGTNSNGSGNDLDNVLVGNSRDNKLNGRGGHDQLTGNGGNDTFMLAAGEANGDEVLDFAGNGALAGDSFRFIGFGTA